MFGLPKSGGQEKDLTGHLEVTKIQKATEALLGDEALHREMDINLFFRESNGPYGSLFWRKEN